MYLVANAWQSKIMASVSLPFIVPRTMLWHASNSSKNAIWLGYVPTRVSHIAISGNCLK